MNTERNLIPYILTAVGSVIFSVCALWYYGYLHFAKPEDALLLSDFTMIKTVPGEEYKVSQQAATEVALCIDGVVVLINREHGLTGVLVDNKKRAVRCEFKDPNVQ